MKFKWSKGKIFLLVSLSLVAVHFLFYRAPSESQMKEKLQARKSEFEQLRLMLSTDTNVRIITQGWTDAKYKKMPDGVESYQLPLNVSAKRLALYRERMKRLGISNLHVDERRNLVRFALFGGGMTDTSWSIGYAYGTETPKALVKKVVVKSAYNQMPGQGGIHFSRIEGDWYIYHLH